MPQNQRIFILAPNTIDNTQGALSSSSVKISESRQVIEDEKKIVNKGDLAPKKYNLNKEIDKIRTGESRISFTAYVPREEAPKKVEVPLEAPKIPKNSIILTGVAVDVFNQNVGNKPNYEDKYKAAQQIFNDTNFKGKNAFIANNPKQVQEIFVALKCQEINNNVAECLSREKEKLNELKTNFEASYKDELFKKYKEEKVNFFDGVLRQGYFTYDFLKSDNTEKSSLTKLKAMSSEYFMSTFGIRNNYQQSIKIEKNLMNKFENKDKHAKETKVNYKLEEWAKRGKKLENPVKQTKRENGREM